MSKIENNSNHDKGAKVTSFTPADMDVLRELEDKYDVAAKQAAFAEKAQRIWARKAASVSISFFLVYYIIGVIFFRSQTDWGLPDTLLFAVYSCTSAGLGHVDIPDTNEFHLFGIGFIMIGIASMAIMIAQVYQMFELEAARAHHKRKAAELARHTERQAIHETDKKKLVADHMWAYVDKFFTFLSETSTGRFLSVFLPLTLTLLVGSVTIGTLEGWTFIESLWFGVAVLTTTGYGDYYPKTTAGVLVTAVWLPCNVLFTSLYMGSIARWYFNLSLRQTQKIREKLMSKSTPTRHSFDYNSSHPLEKDEDSSISDVEQGELASKHNDGLKSVACCDQPVNRDVPLENSTDHGAEDGVLENMVKSLSIMQDVIDAVQCNGRKSGLLLPNMAVTDESGDQTTTDSVRMLCKEDPSKPSFALRTLVQERLAAIVAIEIAGGPHSVDVQDTHIVVRIGRWKDVVLKWFIPVGAYKAFRAAALKAILMVGEDQLIRMGPAALFQLSPTDFHSIFSPLTASMGNGDILVGWFTRTNSMAAKDLQSPSERRHEKLAVLDKEVQMPKSQATSFANGAMFISNIKE
ncbi:hypothetical protein ACA910_015491 [Epithemia clementina (nom. ined.)]